MAGIVILTLDAGGNVPPAVALGSELQRRGHRVRFLGAPTQQDRLRAAGFEVRPYRHVKGWEPARATTFVRDALSFAAVLADKGYARDLADALHEEPADAVVIDALLPGSIPSAVQLGTPVVVLMHTFAEFFLRNPPIVAFCALQGVRPRRAWGSASRVLVAADKGLDPASRRRVPANFVWSGVAELDGHVSPAVRAGSKPKVLASVSTMAIAGQDQVLQRILDAVGGMDVTAVATSGPTLDPTAFRPSANTTLMQTAPHAEILPTCSAVVAHGGHSTTMRALMHGLPLVILPCEPLIDQPMIAAAVARAGAGVALPKNATADRIREAVNTVLTDPSYRQAAERIGTRLREQPGAARAADLVLEAARQRPRV